MTASEQRAANDSWTFALGLYAEPGVADACLTLQSDAGVDVMLMLVVLHAVSQRRIALTAADIAVMDESCRPWREQIVRPLRAVRTILKTGPQPAPSVATETLRSQIKAIELAAERLENDYLAANLPATSSHLHTITNQQIRDAIIAVMRCNSVVTDAVIAAVLPAIDQLVARTEHFVVGQN